MSIQSSSHDSVEDARMALRLYDKYAEIVRAGGKPAVHDMLSALYERGRSVHWRTPYEEAAGDSKPAPGL